MPPIPVTVDKPWTTTVPFAQGVKAAGEFVFTSGITARDRDGRLVGAGDMRAQIGQCFDNVVDVLRAVLVDASIAVVVHRPRIAAVASLTLEVAVERLG